MGKYNFKLDLGNRNSLSVLISRVKQGSTVLEFGPANGRMTKYLKEVLNCKVYAVEFNKEAAKDAAQYTEKIVVDNIENYSWKKEFKDIQFDCITFADILEHLYYPERVMGGVRAFLKESGSILVSIPNVSHNSIIIDLLKNEFNYHPIGLLDSTHIRFFTKKTFDDLIRHNGYFIRYVSALYLRPEDTEFENSYDELPEEIANYLSKLNFGEAYQFVYEIKKHQCKIEYDFL